MSDWKLAGEHVPGVRSTELLDVLRRSRVGSIASRTTSFFLIQRYQGVRSGCAFTRAPATTPCSGCRQIRRPRRDGFDITSRRLPVPDFTTRRRCTKAIGAPRWMIRTSFRGPWPVPDTQWAERSSFLERLISIEEQAHRIAYRGFSRCRLCGEENGHEGLRLEHWEWPAGYRHYIAEHGVCPSAAFEAFIEGVTAGRGPKC